MLVCTVVLPVVIVLLTNLSASTKVNIPNREYWLARERLAETRKALQTRAIALGAMIAVFICFVHWLTVAAQTGEPQRLPLPLFIGGLVALLAATLAWCVLFYRRFALPK